MPDPRRGLGARGERIAETVLAERGVRVVARNVRSRFGEIDLVGHERAGYVFVEVKTRRPSSFVPAVEAVSRRKLARIGLLAEVWLARRGERAAPWRVVVIALTLSGEAWRAEVLDVG